MDAEATPWPRYRVCIRCGSTNPAVWRHKLDTHSLQPSAACASKLGRHVQRLKLDDITFGVDTNNTAKWLPKEHKARSCLVQEALTAEVI